MIKAYTKLITSMLIWGSIALFVRSIPYSSAEIVMFRIIFGLIFLLAVRLFSKKKLETKTVKKNAFKLLLSGFCMGLSWVTLFESYIHVDVSVATIIYYCAPIFVIIGSVVFIKEKLSASKILAIIAAVAGTIIVTGVKMGGSAPGKGLAFAFISAVLYACVTLINKSLSGLDGLDITIGQLISAGIIIIPYALLSHKSVWAMPDLKILLYIAVIGFVHTGIALYFYFSAIQELPTQSVALLSYLDPVSAILFAGIFLHESLSAFQIFGAVLILGSAFFGEIFTKLRKRKA